MPEHPISTYQQLKEKFSADYQKVNKKYKLLGSSRLLVAIGFLIFLYFYFKNADSIFLYPAAFCLILFFYLIKIHQKNSKKKEFLQTLIQINQDELNYLQSSQLPFESGEEFEDHQHAYSSDLDLFGFKSLFQHLNRTATYIGKVKLADLLKNILPETEIHQNQEAVQELSHKINWRQSFLAHGKMSKDTKSIYEQLLTWSNFEQTKISKLIHWISLVSPILLIVLLLTYWFFREPALGNFIFLLFLFHLFLANFVSKRAKGEVINTFKIDEIIKDYSSILNIIQQEPFESQKLKALQAQLGEQEHSAGFQFQKLSSYFSRIDNIQNLIGGIVLNGLFLYHIHTLKKIVAWKNENTQNLEKWLFVLGEVEALNSLANFRMNNPEFIFPELNQQLVINFKDLGHPLIDEEKRICNDISFEQHSFVILTGSNMSGKSTFLRTLGVNMVLAGIGSPICARSANVHPLPVYVSMGQTDSLADNESYFFAEVKRLKYIMDQLEKQVCFILLDEILRGTNSDDKRNGTVGVIEKIIQQKAIGVIATHDLEVCLTTEQHPEILTNKRFEVEIVANELAFDYKLRPGICVNKSATFLMKKMKIIA